MSLQYNNSKKTGGVEFSYKYDVLSERGNKRYAKKEAKTDIRVVAIKLVNYTDRTLIFGTDVKLYQSDREAYLVDPGVVGREIKQTPPLHLLYLLLTPLQLTITQNNQVETYPLGVVLGPGLAVGNMAASATANQKFRQELEYENPIGQEIGPGETFSGLVGIRDVGYNPLTIRVID